MSRDDKVEHFWYSKKSQEEQDKEAIKHNISPYIKTCSIFHPTEVYTDSTDKKEKPKENYDDWVYLGHGTHEHFVNKDIDEVIDIDIHKPKVSF